jgi:hypothetical protein
VVQLVTGPLRFTVDGDVLDSGPGLLAPHELGHLTLLVASEPTVMLLTLLGA